MAMSHENCTHPRTPAGRAACRKSGGPTNAQPATPLKNLKRIEPKPAREHVAARARGWRGAWPTVGDARKRYLRAEHDLVDVPHSFANAIRFAWTKNWDVVATRIIPTEKTVHITSEHGVLALVWNDDKPNAVGSFWRDAKSSVTSRLMTVNVGIDRLNGDKTK